MRDHFPAPAPNYRLTPLGMVLPGTDDGLLPAACVVDGRVLRLGILVYGIAAPRPA